jgi:hypothetical protein
LGRRAGADARLQNQHNRTEFFHTRETACLVQAVGVLGVFFLQGVATSSERSAGHPDRRSFEPQIRCRPAKAMRVFGVANIADGQNRLQDEMSLVYRFALPSCRTILQLFRLHRIDVNKSYHHQRLNAVAWDLLECLLTPKDPCNALVYTPYAIWYDGSGCWNTGTHAYGFAGARRR